MSGLGLSPCQVGVLSAGMLLPAQVDKTPSSPELGRLGGWGIDRTQREGSREPIIPTYLLQLRTSAGWALQDLPSSGWRLQDHS